MSAIMQSSTENTIYCVIISIQFYILYYLCSNCLQPCRRRRFAEIMSWNYIDDKRMLCVFIYPPLLYNVASISSLSVSIALFTVSNVGRRSPTVQPYSAVVPLAVQPARCSILLLWRSYMVVPKCLLHSSGRIVKPCLSSFAIPLR